MSRTGPLATLLVLTLLCAGCTSPASDDDGDGGDGGGGSGGGATATELSLKCWLHTADQTVEFKNTGDGALEWSGLIARCNGTRLPTGDNVSGPGARVSFAYPPGDMVVYVEYEVVVLESVNRTALWSRTLTALT